MKTFMITNDKRDVWVMVGEGIVETLNEWVEKRKNELNYVILEFGKNLKKGTFYCTIDEEYHKFEIEEIN